MVKKILALITVLLLFSAAVVIGFVYLGSTPSFPAVESDTEIKYTSQFAEFLDVVPTASDYYAGNVSSGRLNGQEFNTFSMHCGAVESYKYEGESSSGAQSAQKLSLDVTYGSNSIKIRYARYLTGTRTLTFDNTDYDISYIADTDSECFVAEDCAYLCVHRFNIQFSVPSYIPERYRNDDTLCDFEEWMNLSALMQHHLNEWIDLGTKREYLEDSALYEEYILCEEEAANVYTLCFDEFELDTEYTRVITNVLNDYFADSSAWTRLNSRYTFSDESDGKKSTYVIDLSAPKTPTIESTVTITVPLGTKKTTTVVATLYSLRNATVEKPKKIVDSYYVFSDYVAEKEEEE